MRAHRTPPPSPPSSPLPSLRVLIVDDSALMRASLMHILQACEDVTLLPPQQNGEAALRFLATHPCDVVLLDLDMPLMDGLTAIPLLLALDKTLQIIVVSSLIGKADITLKALQAGAIDYVAKPAANMPTQAFEKALIEKVRLFGMTAQKKRPAPAPAAPRKATPFTLQKNKVLTRPKVIAVGSSIGGPQALFDLLRPLKGHVAQPVVITQHMPSAFTALLARHITTQTGIETVEAAHDMILRDRTVYVAPGNRHMTFARRNDAVHILLDASPPVNHCRPSVDVMLRSLIRLYGRDVLTVILTGLGTDGKDACVALHEQGGGVLAQDEDSSVIWGMPGAVACANICTSVAPVDVLAREVIRIANA